MMRCLSFVVLLALVQWEDAAGETKRRPPEVSVSSAYVSGPLDEFCTVYIDPTSPTIQCPRGSVTFTATGGIGPYVWSTTAGTLTTSGPNNEVATLAPPDPGGTGGEIAFSRSASTLYMHVESWPDCSLQTRMHALYNCAGEFVMCYQTGGGGSCGICAYLTYPTTQPLCQIGTISYVDCGVGGECPPTLDLCEEAKHGVLADHRHDGPNNLIDCHPCVLEMAGAIVTVTDQNGHQAQATVAVQ
ncbi:MAG: hypothetical protein HYX75_16070 [Acidobacteria bacterium]|nr:hypothetical protein [Acidobacteriota bacterium]